jgi:hypothetical protein
MVAFVVPQHEVTMLRYSQPRQFDPAELLFVALIKRALKDARCSNARLQTEASAWLWWFAPAIAQRAGVARATTVAMMVTVNATEMP